MRANTDHERSDARVAPVAKFVLALVLPTLAAFALMSLLFDAFKNLAAAGSAPAAPMAVRDELPPEPRLEIGPRGELDALRAAERERLESYGWRSEEEGAVRLPIERAIDILAERGLPVRGENGESGEGGE